MVVFYSVQQKLSVAIAIQTEWGDRTAMLRRGGAVPDWFQKSLFCSRKIQKYFYS